MTACSLEAPYEGPKRVTGRPSGTSSSRGVSSWNAMRKKRAGGGTSRAADDISSGACSRNQEAHAASRPAAGRVDLSSKNTNDS